MRIYRDILKSAWQVLWHNAWLWPFGVVAALIGGSGEYSSIVSSVDRIATRGAFLESLRNALISHELQDTWSNMVQKLAQDPGLVLGTALGVLVVAVIVLWLVIVSQAALIHGIASVETFQPTNFVRAGNAGAQKFWPIFWINVVAKLFTALVMAVALLPFLISFLAQGDKAGSFNALIIISFLVFVPLALTISFILKYAAIAAVLDNLAWWQAISHAINLFFRNWLVSLEMAALMFGVSFVLSIAVYSLIPLTFGIDLALLANQFSLVQLLRVLPTALLLLFAGAWFSTFQYAAWTILYQKLARGPVVAKLLRAADDIPAYLEVWMGRMQMLNPPKTPPSKR